METAIEEEMEQARTATPSPSVSSSRLGLPAFSPEQQYAPSISPHRTASSCIPIPVPKVTSSSAGSVSVHREPIRCFIHSSLRERHQSFDVTLNARSVRRDTAELASYGLSYQPALQSSSVISRPLHDISSRANATGQNTSPRAISIATFYPLPISQGLTAGPASAAGAPITQAGPSLLSGLLRHFSENDAIEDDAGRHPLPEILDGPPPVSSTSQQHHMSEPTERSPLLGPHPSLINAGNHPRLGTDSGSIPSSGSDPVDEENQKPRRGPTSWTLDLSIRLCGRLARFPSLKALGDQRALWQNIIFTSVSCLPAVAVGLLLNILDALSYGMILFPLGKPIFAHLGSAGVSIFYISTIVSQLAFSSGSIFKGAVGSEMIEVVPFFHNMAKTITRTVGEDNPDAVIATTMVSYAASSIMTGVVFYLMGHFHFGYMVGFIPRHILIGCIGGVGWFLLATGFEVSVRLDGGIKYDLDTLYRILRPDTAPMWGLPLALAVTLFYTQARVSSKYFLPLYILCIPLLFYLAVQVLGVLDLGSLRDAGWVFTGPPSGEPWWYFYTLYKFKLVRWDAVVETIPAMMALTFFGILHVPINVPALALKCGEDDADLDVELKLHGYTNVLSGLSGSIQNYLVYANTVFFMRSGGDHRVAGFLLACCTFMVMVMGPSLIGLIPVMMVGTLIYDLAFELLLEAVWLSRKKLKAVEYVTVLVIVLVMGICDFVVGIGVGILLAFISLIIQTSRVSAVRGSYSGDVVASTVRRTASLRHYLQRAGRQIYMIKLTGYLFFGTIVGVEAKIRGMVAEDGPFAAQPVRFLVIDMWHVSGLDYSAGEAFRTVSRLLGKKGVSLVLSGVDPESPLGRNLRAVGLGEDGFEVAMLPDLNSALECCENELLKSLFAKQAEWEEASSQTAQRCGPEGEGETQGTGNGEAGDRDQKRWADARGPDQPREDRRIPVLGYALLQSKGIDGTGTELESVSPRVRQLALMAEETLHEVSGQTTTKAPTGRWHNFSEPLRLMLHVLDEVSNLKEDFWFPAAGYFVREQHGAGTTLYRRGDSAVGFYLVEQGELRAECELPQGRLYESIMAGTTCGELPFFAETERTATVVAERDAIVWLLGSDAWIRMRAERPDIAMELMRVTLKLTTERMEAITCYILATAG